MDIFQRIKNKASQALGGINGFFNPQDKNAVTSVAPMSRPQIQSVSQPIQSVPQNSWNHPRVQNQPLSLGNILKPISDRVDLFAQAEAQRRQQQQRLDTEVEKMLRSRGANSFDIESGMVPMGTSWKDLNPDEQKFLSNKGVSMVGGLTGDVASKTSKAMKGISSGVEVGGDVGKTITKKVKAPKVKVLNTSTINTGNKVTNLFRDISSQTPERLKSLLGEVNYNKRVAPIINEGSELIAKGQEFKNVYRTKLDSILKNSNIRVGSDDDKLLYMFRKKGGASKVASKVGADRANQLKAAYDTLRQSYDEIIDVINTQRVSAGLREIPKKKDFLSQVSRPGSRSLDDILSGSASTTDEISSGIFKKQGKVAQGGAIESMNSYLDLAERAGFTDITAKRYRDLAQTIGEQSGVPSKVNRELNSLSDTITGVKQTSVPERILDTVLGRAKGAAVFGKASTLFNQTLSLPTAIVQTGPINFVKGMIKKTPEVKQSPLLRSMTKVDPMSLRKGGDKITGAMGDVLASANKSMYEVTWKGMLEKAKGMKVSNPIQWADQETARILGDRRLGMMPKFYNSILGKTIGAFTIEQTAQMTTFARDIGKKNWGKVLGTLIAWKVGNEITRNVTGRTPFFDPVDAIVDSLELGAGSDKKKKSEVKAATRLLVEVMQLSPVISSAAYNAYALGDGLNLLPDSKEVFDDDPTWMNTKSMLNPFENINRNITGNRYIDTPLNVAAKVIPGVGQLNSALQAGTSLVRGYAETNYDEKDGTTTPTYLMNRNIPESVKALLFGQSSTKAAQDWYGTDFAPYLTDKQEAAFNGMSPDQKVPFLQGVQPTNENIKKINYGTDQIGTGKTPTTTSTPKNKAEMTALKEQSTAMLDAGMVPTVDQLKSLFNGYTTQDKSLETRNKAYKNLETLMTNELYSDEQKQAILSASGTNPDDYAYYELASKDWETKLQNIAPLFDNMSEDEVVQSLIVGRKAIGNKQMITNDMIDYLYENDVISKDVVKMIKAVKFDEIKGKYYVSKSYKGSGGMSVSAATKAYKTTPLKLDRQKGLDYLSKTSSPKTGYDNSGEQLLENILRKR